jgi:hypothetical protein
LFVFACSDEWRKGFGKVERVDVVQGEVAVLEGVKKLGVWAPTGTEGLDR